MKTLLLTSALALSTLAAPTAQAACEGPNIDEVTAEATAVGMPIIRLDDDLASQFMVNLFGEVPPPPEYVAEVAEVGEFDLLIQDPNGAPVTHSAVVIGKLFDNEGCFTGLGVTVQIDLARELLGDPA